MSLMPLQAVPVPRTGIGRQTSCAARHPADGAEQSMNWRPMIPFEDGAEQSWNWRPQMPFEDAGAEQSWGTYSWNSLDYPFEG